MRGLIIQDSFDIHPTLPTRSVTGIGNDQILCGNVASTTEQSCPKSRPPAPLQVPESTRSQSRGPAAHKLMFLGVRSDSRGSFRHSSPGPPHGPAWTRHLVDTHPPSLISSNFPGTIQSILALGPCARPAAIPALLRRTPRKRDQDFGVGTQYLF